MKRILLIATLITFSLDCIGQISEKEINKFDLSIFDNNGDGKANKTEAAKTIGDLYTIENNGLTRFFVIDSLFQKKNELFLAVSNWFSAHFKLSDSQIQLSDKDAGVIIGKGIIPDVGSTKTNSVWGLQSVSVEITLRVDVKDNRIRINPTIMNYIIDNKGKKSTAAVFGSVNNYNQTKDNSISFLNPVQSFPYTNKDRKLAEIGLTNGHIALLLMSNNLEKSLRSYTPVSDSEW